MLGSGKRQLAPTAPPFSRPNIRHFTAVFSRRVETREPWQPLVQRDSVNRRGGVHIGPVGLLEDIAPQQACAVRRAHIPEGSSTRSVMPLLCTWWREP